MSKTNSKTNMENQLRKPTTGAEAAKATAVPTKSPRPAGPCCARMVAAPVYLTHFTVSFEKLRHLNCCCYSIVGINNEWNRKLVARAATGSATGSTGNWRPAKESYISIELKKLHCLSYLREELTIQSDIRTWNECTLENNRCLCWDKADTFLQICSGGN